MEYGSENGRVYGILEWMEGLSVRRYAHELLDKKEDNKILDLAVQCVKALIAVHEKGYLHGDVHLGNFLMRGKNVCLIDFGLARPIELKAEEEINYIDLRFGDKVYIK